VTARMKAFGDYVDDGSASTIKERDYKDATDLIAFSCKYSGSDSGLVSPTLRSMNGKNGNSNGGGQVAVSFDTTQVTNPTNQSIPGPVCHTLAKGQHAPAVVASAVRRLTPRECERLQGFPDDWTNVPYRGKPACDGPRYKAIGNSMAVNVMSWIGQRLQTTEAPQ